MLAALPPCLEIRTMSRRTVALLAIIIIAVAFGVGRITHTEEEEAPVVMPEPRVIEIEDLVAYGDLEAHTYRVRSSRDVLPGGYSAAMAPVMVDWANSEIADGGHVVIKNINDGGNPLSGVTELRSARIHFDRITEVQFILVPLGGPEAVSHGQLRFVFEEGSAEWLGGHPEGVVGEPDVFDDLILSWEAWRPPGVSYDAMKGMREDAYMLSLRAYSGRQRFLEDALGPRDWKCFDLELPGGQRGWTELLLVGLALGDGSGRAAIGQMLDHAEEAWLSKGPRESEDEKNAAAQWMKVREEIQRRQVHPHDQRLDMSETTTYQTLIRSCASLALYNIDVAVQRLIEDGQDHEGMRATDMAPIDDVPEWMSQLSDANLAGVFARAPAAIGFLKKYPTAIPSEIPNALDRAGLLVREDGKPRMRIYTMSGMTPWGHRNQLLIR